MFDLTFQAVFVRAGAYLLLATVQGLTVAAMAVALGDRGPRYDGRISLAPARHLDALGAASFICFGLGWSRFVEIDGRRLRGGWIGLALVVVGGALALVAAAVALRMLVAPALTTLPMSGALVAAAFLRSAAMLLIGNAVFSLLPLPPLPGSHLLELAGIRTRRSWDALLGLLLLVLVGTGVAGALITPGVAALAAWVQDWSPR